MEFEEELSEYVEEVDRIYRRSLDAPLHGLTSEQTEAIKKFQFEARNQRERLHKIALEWLREYRNAKTMMYLMGIFPEDHPPLAALMARSKSEAVALREGLKRGAKELEKALTIRGRPLPLTEKDIVNPIDRSLSPAQKAAQLAGLSLANEPIVKSFIERIDATGH